MRIKRSPKVIAAAGVAVVLAAGAAFAFWTAGGTGTGQAAAGDTVDLVVHQGSPIVGLTPGGTPMALSGTFDNANTSAIRVNKLAAVVSSVTPVTCDPDNFAIGGAVNPTDVGAGPGTGQGTWSGLTIQLKETGLDQNACKNAQVTLNYTVNPSTAARSGYSAIPAIVPANMSSFGPEAYAFTELGSQVALAGPGRTLQSMSVVFSSWGCASGAWTSKDCQTTPGTTFDVPVTFNIYASNAGQRGALLATEAKTVAFAYRPSSSPECQGDNAGKWYNTANSTCYNGKSQTVTMDTFAAVTLPDEVIWTVQYNTTSHGPRPIGTATCRATPAGCGYDALNVGAMTYSPTPYLGTDLGGVVNGPTLTSADLVPNRPLGAIATS